MILDLGIIFPQIILNFDMEKQKSYTDLSEAAVDMISILYQGHLKHILYNILGTK